MTSATVTTTVTELQPERRLTAAYLIVAFIALFIGVVTGLRVMLSWKPCAGSRRRTDRCRSNSIGRQARQHQPRISPGAMRRF